MTACAVCAAAIVDHPQGRERLYCSRACRARAYRDRRDGRLRLLGGNDGLRYAPRPGLARIAPGEYATRDDGIRVVADGRRWKVLVRVVDGFVWEDDYPTLRAVRDALDVPLRRR